MGVVLSVETDVSSIHLLHGAGEDPRLGSSRLGGEMLAEFAAEGHGACIAYSGWDDESFVDVLAEYAVNVTDASFVCGVVEGDRLLIIRVVELVNVAAIRRGIGGDILFDA